MEDLVRYYREHDDFLRYTIHDRARKRALSKLRSENKAYFGTRVLDVACGGGVLSSVLAGEDHEYVGLDKNPDMIKTAKEHTAEGSKSTFILGDAASIALEGVFDTVTLLGNALIHFSASELREVIRHLEGHVRVGSHFLVEYRDVVSILFDGKWNKKFIERRGNLTVTSLTRGIDVERGAIAIGSRTKGATRLEFTHAVWSPFILESLMSGLSWSLVKRRRTKGSYVWLDIYRKA